MSGNKSPHFLEKEFGLRKKRVIFLCVLIVYCCRRVRPGFGYVLCAGLESALLNLI